MNAVELIAKKRDGHSLSRDEIAFFIRGLVKGDIPDYQAAALLMAGRIRGFDEEETQALTMEMLHSGATVDLSAVRGIKADKHSTGGVGDKTSLIVMPIIAAAGLIGAKMSGRGLGHTGGTLDKLEAIPGLSTSLSRERFLAQLNDIGLAIIGQTAELVPADKLLYALRDVTATVDSIPLIAASIMSKKLAMAADVLVLDVKYGSGAIIEDRASSRELASLMVRVAKEAGIRASALLSSMQQPLGRAIGNALEIAEVLEVLDNGGPDDLREAALALAGELIYLAGLCQERRAAREEARRLLASGAAKAKFLDMVAAQGGDIDFGRLPRARYVEKYYATASGTLLDFRLNEVGMAAVALGAGREKKGDAIDYGAGLILEARIGDRLLAGQAIAQLHAGDMARIEQARSMLDKAIIIGQGQGREEPLIAEIICSEEM